MNQELLDLTSLYQLSLNSFHSNCSERLLPELYTKFIKDSPYSKHLPNFHDFISSLFNTLKSERKVSQKKFLFLIQRKLSDDFIFFKGKDLSPSILSVDSDNAFSARKMASTIIFQNFGIEIEVRDFIPFGITGETNIYHVFIEFKNSDHINEYDFSLQIENFCFKSQREVEDLVPSMVLSKRVKDDELTSSNKQSRKNSVESISESTDLSNQSETRSRASSRLEVRMETDLELGQKRAKIIQDKFETRINQIASRFDWSQ